MATFYGTNNGDTITPATVSAGVIGLFGSHPGDLADVIYGLGGNDMLAGGGGADQIFGGVGRDVIFGWDGNDVIQAGSELDDGNPVSDMDTVYAGYGNDYVAGGEDADRLFGQAGSDTLNGGKGDDLLVGGSGHDAMSGGDGHDVYRFDAAADSVAGANRDVVGIDVSGVGANLGDQIDLSQVYAGTLTFRGTGAFTGVDQVRVVDQADTGNTIIQVNLSGDAKPEMEILALDGDAHAGKWVSTDFVL